MSLLIDPFVPLIPPLNHKMPSNIANIVCLGPHLDCIHVALDWLSVIGHEVDYTDLPIDEPTGFGLVTCSWTLYLSWKKISFPSVRLVFNVNDKVHSCYRCEFILQC